MQERTLNVSKRLAVVAACALSVLPALAHKAWAETFVTTSVGQLEGIEKDGALQFLGIPYAQPPVGDLRWRAPKPAQPWAGVRLAKAMGPSCAQLPDVFGPNGSLSEDCLTLNVYAPVGKSKAPRPVVVWLHPGGFMSGSGNYFDASTFANKIDAIVVTINYRLGPFAGLTTTGMLAETKAVNFGLQDQQEALRWVRKHIGAFGGDHDRVTLAGQSAGAISTCMAMISPPAKGLFQRAIMQSGPCGPTTVPLTTAQTRGDALSTRLGCEAGADQMACLRSKSTQELLTMLIPASLGDLLNSAVWPTVIDGQIVPQAPQEAISQGKFHRVPVMLGTTLDDGRGMVGTGVHPFLGHTLADAEYQAIIKGYLGDFAGSAVTTVYPSSKYGNGSLALAQALTDVALACPTLSLGNRLASQVPTYAFEFTDRTAPQYYTDPYMPEGWGAYHGGEFLYLFGKPIASFTMPALNAQQSALSARMQGYWKQFVATGSPNGREGSRDESQTPTWPRMKGLLPSYLSFASAGPQVQSLARYGLNHNCALWIPASALLGS